MTTVAGPQRGGGRPTRGYRLADGKERVPSVTTVVGRFKESGALIQWAYKQGLEGKDINKSRDDAANAGTLAHDLIEADILGVDPKLPSAAELGMSTEDYTIALDRAARAFAAFREWRRAVALDVVWTELPLVSAAHRFGGTIDAVARIGGATAIFDWKSSGRIYSDYIVQVAAYRALWDEHNAADPIQSIHLVRVGKEYGDFHHHSWPMPVIDLGWRAFRLQLELYGLDESLKRAAA